MATAVYKNGSVRGFLRKKLAGGRLRNVTTDGIINTVPRRPRFAESAGVPDSNAEQVGDYCWDKTNSDLYQAADVAGTWTKVVD